LLPSPAEGEQGGAKKRSAPGTGASGYWITSVSMKAAEKLGDQEILGRDVFTRPETGDTGENEEVEEASLFDLMEALRGSWQN